MRLQYLLMNRTCVSLQSAVSGANVGAAAQQESSKRSQRFGLCAGLYVQNLGKRCRFGGTDWVCVGHGPPGSGVAAGRKWTSFRDASKILRSVSFDVNQTEKNKSNCHI